MRAVALAFSAKKRVTAEYFPSANYWPGHSQITGIEQIVYFAIRSIDCLVKHTLDRLSHMLI